MLSDFEMIIRKFPSRPNLKIYPISDVHFGAAEHMEREWNNFCNNLLRDENAYIILGGDLINNGTKSSVSNCYEETVRPREQKRIMTEMLMPLRDRILCMVSGNHERRNKDVDDDPSYDIACKLDVEHLYRENIAFLKIQMGNNRTNGQLNPTYVLAVTHGAGGGILTGGSVNRNERFGYVLDGVDALIVGHTHKPFVTQPSKIQVDSHNHRITVKPFKIVSSTSWLKWGGYAAQKMLTPTSHAPQIITLKGKEKYVQVTM